MNSNNREQKKYLLTSVALLGLILLLTGCSSLQVGRDFDMQIFKSSVIAGETSKSQVQGWLGAPKSTGASLDKDGEVFDEWIYYYGTGKMSQMDDAKLKMLQIRFNQNGIVRSYNWSDSK